MPEVFLKLLVAISPAIVLTFILLRKDNNSPEPLRWLLAAIGLGVLIPPVILLMAFLGWPDYDVGTFGGAILSSFVSAAIPEESLKFAALYFIAKRCRHFDEMFDGIVYAVCIGMGFAGIENIFYLFAAEENWFFIGISRALMSVPMHYFFAVIMGAFFSQGWFDGKKRTSYLAAALLIPIAVHGIYDTFCFTMGLDEEFCQWGLIVFLIGFKYIRRYVKSLTNSMLKLDGIES